MVHSYRLHDAVTPVQVDALFRALPRRRPGQITKIGIRRCYCPSEAGPEHRGDSETSRQQHREDSDTYYCYCYTSGMLTVIVIVPSVIVVIACYV